MSEREELLARAAQDFIDKVDRGEARSSKSYRQFKDALGAAPAQGVAPSGIEIERERCEKIARNRAVKLRAQAKQMKSAPPRANYFARAMEASVIADAIRALKSSDGSEAADGAIGAGGLTDQPRKCEPSQPEGETTRLASPAPGPSVSTGSSGRFTLGPPVEVRKVEDVIDEIVIRGSDVHIEQMSNDNWYMGVEASDGSHWQFWFGAKNRKSHVEFRRHFEVTPAASNGRPHSGQRGGDICKWIDDQIAEASGMQKASFQAGKDLQGERWHARQCALYEVRLKVCGAESNRHSGAVGSEKRAEQSSPGGDHEVASAIPHENRENGAGRDEPTPGQSSCAPSPGANAEVKR
ncbi:hypothetical protein JQ633_00895 [Bradyrhizobium tropiciagri]|uniref:hypothetical protein n=1 Tax=Bradyrhizobium tropiciagri TaxID=312253 RepID=UPI001BAE035A|nr:hypothetical protein [Bradyrhizobium tropiciagri]MBR0868897.1 hypothetical protein [Bradyrhizobium tropiciagri]